MFLLSSPTITTVLSMPLTRAQEEESKIEAGRTAEYRGTVRIRLEWLHFREEDSTKLDRGNIERLKAVFRKDCRRADIKNHVPAVIDQQHLDGALQASSDILPARFGSKSHSSILHTVDACPIT